MQKKVLLAFDDPGGGLVVTALIDKLKSDKRISLSIYSGKLSEKILKAKKISFEKMDSALDKAGAKKILSKVDPDVIVTATSGGSGEQELRNAALTIKIPSVVILDFWKDYSRRWLYATYHINEMKDKVCVMDEMTKEEMIDEKFPKDKLAVTGQPYLDFIFNNDNKGLFDEEGNSILFLSQPLDIIGVSNYQIHPLEIVVKAIEKLSTGKKKQKLSIRLHPGEKLSPEIKKITEKYGSDKIEIKLENKSRKLDDLIKQASVVIGYNSIALFEARAKGKRVISINAGQVKNSLKENMKNAGIETADLAEKEIVKILKQNKTPELKKNLFKGGIEKCIKTILKEVNLN